MFTLYIRNADGTITEVPTPDLPTLSAARGYRNALLGLVPRYFRANIKIRFPKAGSAYYAPVA